MGIDSSDHFRFQAILLSLSNSPTPGGGKAFRVKISRGAPLEVQSGTQQDLNEMIDLVILGGKKMSTCWKWGFRNGTRVKISRGAPLEVQSETQQDLNEMIDLVILGGKKIVYMLKMGLLKWNPTRSE